jgi:NAD(P)-dependent dehydrogenase (short-subunit alcohol dehydrogenase family)
MDLPDITETPLEQLFSLKGRRAVVTGGAWGLGRATVRRLAQAGASVVIADLDAEKGQESASDLSAETGGRVLFTPVDVADGASVDAAANFAASELGGIDIWINNAGLTINEPLVEMSIETWDKHLTVNTRGMFLGAQAAARRMIAAGKGGVIVNLASLAGLEGIAPDLVAYVASKHGVVGATRQMGIELAPEGIRVLAVAPGFHVTEKTSFLKDADPEILSQIPIPGIAGSRLGRVGVPDDIARVILFCVSDLALFMSGTTLVVDGATSS